MMLRYGATAPGLEMLYIALGATGSIALTIYTYTLYSGLILTMQLPGFESHIDIWVALAATISLVVVAAMAYPDRYFGTKSRPDLPGPRGIPLLGNLIQLLPHRKRMLFYLAELEHQYGELFTFTMPGWGRNIVINRPEWLEHTRKQDGVGYGKGPTALAMFRQFPGVSSAFSTEGTRWKASRQVTKFTFDSHVSRAMSEIVPVAKELLTSAAKDGLEVDFDNFCGRIVLAIFCKTSMSVETNMLTSDPACLSTPDRMMDAVMTLNHISSGRLYDPLWQITEIFTGTRRAFNLVRSELYDIVNNIIQDRKMSCEDKGDFLSTLLSDSSLGAKDPDFLRDTLVTLLFASRDNTQNVLGWSLYEMSRKPEWFDKMREEALALKDLDGEVTRYGELSKYHIHLAVFYETLRLWPGVPKNARLALRDDVLPAIPEYGYGPVRISKGDYILWSDFSMMRNPKVWGSDATDFNPARHLDAEGKFIKPSQPKFHAFGSGPRLCPGAQLSAYEFVAIWAAFLPSFDFKPVEMKDRLPTDALTMSMQGPFMITVILGHSRSCGKNDHIERLASYIH
ncbi:putative monooxygenase [Serpula lacrymans var. lacrymans S7.9]|uniref:Putative monooxygenase n=1 Tax=Serpula lacrymans var. lacrymans (strain S7.9) TaxID=578457 RepID=F8NLH7_SERL9|nr:putative monooxygenase [Serpula lacrymans var. lacrymans S7.9]EGO28594.1 putative monooxygenase [Serpula lacrymans var. lacrymans S7.9]